MWIFEVFYRKRIAAALLPLQAEVDNLRLELSVARSMLSAVRIQNTELLGRVDALNAELERANPKNGLPRSHYANIALPYPLVDRDGKSLTGTYQGHPVEFSLSCEGQGDLKVLRASLMQYDQLAYYALDAIGEGTLRITIRQKITVDGRTTIWIDRLGSIDIRADVDEYQMETINCLPMSMLLQRARENAPRIDSDS